MPTQSLHLEEEEGVRTPEHYILGKFYARTPLTILILQFSHTNFILQILSYNFITYYL